MTGQLTNQPERPSAQESSKNRAAFLLGFYLQIPAVEAVIDPLVMVGGCLPVVSVLLIDNCLSRIGSLDVGIAIAPRRQLRPGLFVERTDRERADSFLRHQETIKLRALARNLWKGRSELRAWYVAGVAVGILAVRLEESVENGRPKVTDFSDLVDAACAEIREAAKWSTAASVTSEACERICKLPGEWLEYTAAPTPSAAVGDWRCERVENLARLIVDIQRATLEKVAILEERAQFIYEGFTVHGLYGKSLQTMVNEEGKIRGWESIERQDKLRAYANKFASDHQLPPIPDRAPGREVETK